MISAAQTPAAATTYFRNPAAGAAEQQRTAEIPPQGGSGRKTHTKSKAATGNCTQLFAQRVQPVYWKARNGRSRAQPLRSWGIKRGPFFR